MHDTFPEDAEINRNSLAHNCKIYFYLPYQSLDEVLGTVPARRCGFYTVPTSSLFLRYTLDEYIFFVDMVSHMKGLGCSHISYIKAVTARQW